MIIVVALIAGLAGLLFGFDEGVIAGALSSLRAEFNISAVNEGLMTSAVPFGALFGALLAGALADRYGRRPTLLFAAVLFTAGAIWAGEASAFSHLVAARLVLGLAVGLAATVAPMYISESAPAARRGTLVSVYQLAITLGILGAYLVNYGFHDQWRHMFMLGALPGVALLLGMLFLNDTPRWYFLNGQAQKARSTLARVNGVAPDDPRIEAALGAMNDTARSSAPWKALLEPAMRPALVVGVGLFLLQQFSGINAVIYYAPNVFREAGFESGTTQITATIGVGVVNVLMTLVGMYFIDRVGRRRLMLLGFAGMAVSLGLIGLGAATQAQFLDVLAVVGLMFYIGAFAASLGPLPWVMMAEIYPSAVRGPAMAVTSLTNWGFNFLVVFSFPALVAALGLGGVFMVYALVCIAGLFFAWLRVPETRGVSLEAIEAHLMSGKPFRDLAPSVVIDADRPGISADQATPLLHSLIALSPYRDNLHTLHGQIVQVACDNQQVSQALLRVQQRVRFQEGMRLRLGHLGSDRSLLMTFLEHIHYASPAFMRSVGEPANPENTRG